MEPERLSDPFGHRHKTSLGSPVVSGTGAPAVDLSLGLKGSSLFQPVLAY